MNIDKEPTPVAGTARCPFSKAKKAHRHANGPIVVAGHGCRSVRDFQAFAGQTGNELVEQQTAGSDFIQCLAPPLILQSLHRQRAQIVPEVGAHLRVLERELHRRFQKPLPAAVVALCLRSGRHGPFGGDQALQCHR